DAAPDPRPRAERAVAAQREREQQPAERHQHHRVLTGARAFDEQQESEQQLGQLVDPEGDASHVARVVVGAGHHASLRVPSGVTGSLRLVTRVAPPEWARHLPAGLEPEAVDLLARRTLPAAWAANWRAAPDAPVVGDERGWLTNAELDRRSRAIAGRLAGAGLGAGDRVVMSAATSIELVVAHVAALRLGLVVVPVNGAYRAREIGHIVDDCSPAACIVDHARTELFAAAVGDGGIVTTP